MDQGTINNENISAERLATRRFAQSIFINPPDKAQELAQPAD